MAAVSRSSTAFSASATQLDVDLAAVSSEEQARTLAAHMPANRYHSCITQSQEHLTMRKNKRTGSNTDSTDGQAGAGSSKKRLRNLLTWSVLVVDNHE